MNWRTRTVALAVGACVLASCAPPDPASAPPLRGIYGGVPQEILATRPSALLGTFHNPWSDEDFDGARLEKLAIEWIARQVSWLGRYLQIEGVPGERHRIWPIVQIADWGEPVPHDQVATVLEHGARPPATGVMVFNWSGLRKQPEKIEAIGRAFRAMRARPIDGQGACRDRHPEPDSRRPHERRDVSESFTCYIRSAVPYGDIFQRLAALGLVTLYR